MTYVIAYRQPLVTVILPVYNAEPFLDDAIRSVLRQTLDDFDLIIVNDGSSDASGETISRYAQRDRRIKAIDNERNIGLIGSLNIGLGHSRGEYIARQDADDVSYPDRLARQVEFMQARPEIGLLGTAMEVVDHAGLSHEIYRQPETDSLLRFRLLFNNAFVHTSVMFRREVLARHELQYDLAYAHAEDYDLWTRMLQFVRGHNLQDPLVQYRILTTSVSQQKASEQITRACAISDRQIRRLTPTLDLSWTTRCRMLACFMKHLWTPLEPFSDDELIVVPAMHEIAQRALRAFPSVDDGLRSFEARLRRILEPSGQKWPKLKSSLRHLLNGRR